MAIVIIGAILIGLTLGMLGSGGSAITVPVLVYLVGHGGKVSIAESMAIVGLISLAASIPYGRHKQIDWRSVLYFGVPGMLGTYGGAWLGGMARDALQLIVFGLVLLLAAVAMLRKQRLTESTSAGDAVPYRPPIWRVAIEGTVVGMVTGFVGVGGGFLIVPALVVLGHLPMRLAIGTSLVIIAAKSAVGFAKYQSYLLDHDLSVDFRTILIFAVIGVLGSFVGRAINRHLDQQTLRRVFASFLVLLGGFVIVREAVNLLPEPDHAAANVRAQDEIGVATWHPVRTVDTQSDLSIPSRLKGNDS